MTVRELREKYLAFFETKGHKRFPSGSLIPYDVTGRLDESLLFNGAGMVQFKPYFRGVAQPDHKRLITCQKCVRTGDIEEVGDTSHLTFFEMLGNFSFGDYFKAEAIAYSWEFLTEPKWLGLDPKRLSFTIFEEDDVAYDEWTKWISSAGIDPSTRIFRLGEETNYWPAGAFSKGPPGPCGPNSEMFFWVPADEAPPATGIGQQAGGYTREQWLADESQGKWLEIWNDVFIQYEWQGRLRNPDRPSDGFAKEAMPELPFRSIDTGMGLDRTAAVLMGGGSVYKTDSFAPIFRLIEQISEGDFNYSTAAEESKVAARIIADHIRTAVFCIADGVLPGNTGRGYVLRRLIRRAVLKGQRVLGFNEPFFHRVYEGVVEAMGDFYHELTERRDIIVETLKNEEEQFRRTLASGYDQFLNALRGNLAYALAEKPGSTGDTLDITSRLQVPSDYEMLCASEGLQSGDFPGDTAFKLYDTYGFPLEVTQELAREAGIEVDVDAYERSLKEAQERSRGGQEREAVYGDRGMFGLIIQIENEEETPTQTVFVGYDQSSAQTEIVGVLPAPTASDEQVSPRLVVALKESPFYAESGGQVADLGTIAGGGFEARVLDVIKQNGVWVHEVEPLKLPPGVTVPSAKASAPAEMRDLQKKFFRLKVEADIDVDHRRRVIKNHTATHLLHAALRQVLGKHVTQAGSYVGPDRLRFDFTHGKAMTDEELREVERIVNEKVWLNTSVTIYPDLAIAEAKAKGAMALFGEKYGDRVRMVEIGDFSRELCGGCHVRRTGEIGLFKIVHEASAASGVRRIEALTGEGAYEWVLELLEGVQQAATKLKLPAKSGAKELLHGIDRLQEAQRDLKQRLEKARTQAPSGGASRVQTVGSVEFAVEGLKDADSKDAAALADSLAAGHANRVVLVGSTSDGKVTFVCKAGAEAVQKGAHAGNLLREVSRIAGGGGGGRPDFATAGGKDPGKLDEALQAAAQVLQGQLKS